jgi:hypothetical protein
VLVDEARARGGKNVLARQQKPHPDSTPA